MRLQSSGDDVVLLPFDGECTDVVDKVGGIMVLILSFVCLMDFSQLVLLP